jgi:biotin carboxylase
MRKTVLVAGGSHSDIPFIKAIQSLGHAVITSGNRAMDFGHGYADAVALADFSDPEAMLVLAEKLGIDAICPSANDFSMISSAYVAEHLGLPGYDSYDTTLMLHHKDRFRELGSQIGLTAPKAKHFKTPEIASADITGLCFPLIVKPIDLTGGKGVSRIDNLSGFPAAVRNAFDSSRAKRIVVEEFFSGTLHSYSTIIRDHKVIFEFCDNEFSFLNPYTVSTSTTPATVSPMVLAAVRRETEHLAKTLNLVDGILHGQFLATPSDFRIIEFTRRPPGDFYAVPVEHTTGINPAELAVRPFLGRPLSLPTPRKPDAVYFSRYCLMADREGIFQGTQVAPEIEANIVDRLVVVQPGHRVDNYLNERLGIFFLRYGSSAEMEDKTACIHKLISASMSGPGRP